MKTKKIMFTFLVILLMYCCNSNSQVKMRISKSIKDKDTVTLSAEVQTIENFQLFLMQFQKDFAFQCERIVFPLKNSLYNTETSSFNENTIKQDDWAFIDFINLPVNYLKNIEKINNYEFQYNIQIEDTGVSVNYIFKLINGKWYLIEIKDEST